MPLTLSTRTHGRPTTDPQHTTPAPDDRGRSWLTRLSAGDPAFPPVVPAALPPAGTTPAEYAAAARALGCRDLFVVDAADRAARERVIADLVRAAALRGERVLALSPDPAAADRIAEAVAADGSVRVVRAMSADENPYRLSPGAARLTSAAAGTGRVEHARRETAAAITGLEAGLPSLSAAVAIAEDLRALADRFTAAERDRAAVAARRDNLDAEVRDEADGKPTPTAFTAAVDRLKAEQAAAAPARAERESVAARRAEKEAALAAARQHLAEAAAEAARKPGFFARLLGKPKHHADPADLERQVHDLEREVQELADREAKLGADLDAAAARFAADREKLVADEATARRAELDARVAALAAERDEAAGRFALRGRDLDRLGLTPPVQLLPEAVARVVADLDARRRDAEDRLAAARSRLDEITRTARETARAFLAEVRAVVGTPGSPAADPVFDAAGRADPPFGLLVLDRAEELTEPDFARLSRLAGRWVLAGDASYPGDPLANGSGSFPRPTREPRHRGRRAEPTFAARVARLLDREPWAVEGDRLVFRLAHVAPAQRWAVTREPVLDRPEVELRFAADESGRPVVVEVAFPAATPVAEAKAFLAEQLGEVLLRPCGERHWHPAADHLTVCWPAAECVPADGVWVGLGDGVREKVCGTGPGAFTAALTFDPAAGWDAEKAEGWLAAHLPDGSPGRVAVVPPGPPVGHGASPHRAVVVV